MLISTAAGGGTGPAKIRTCGSTMDVSMDSGKEVSVQCSSSNIEVVTGPVTVTFTTPDGTETTAELSTGFSLRLNTENFTVSAGDDNPGSVDIVVNGVTISLGPDDPPVSVDTTAPVINSVTANPATLRPPNHKMRPVALSVDVLDLIDDDVFCEITRVVSNEAVDAKGSGKTEVNWTITGDLTVDLRAERSGKGPGRVYTITVVCTDDAENTSEEDTVEVTVAHDQRKKK